MKIIRINSTGKLGENMNDISNNELLSKLEEIINTKTNELKTELKTEIQSLRESLDNKTKELEERCNRLEQRIISIERFNRRNNIVIFGIEANKNELLEVTTGKLNGIFGSNLTEGDINNIYSIGKKGVVILEFLSYIQKQKIFQNLKKLRGTGISISHDLRIEDQVINKALVKHLKSARNNNYQAYIKNHKLIVNGTPYTLEELEETNIDCEIELPPKANSAPSTPIARRNLTDQEDIPTESEVFDKNTRDTVEEVRPITQNRVEEKKKLTATTKIGENSTVITRANLRSYDKKKKYYY